MYSYHEDLTAGNSLIIELDKTSYSVNIKNLSNGDIRVTLGDGYNKDNYILIPPFCSQICTINKRKDLAFKFDKVGIYAETTANNGVEVQCLEF